MANILLVEHNTALRETLSQEVTSQDGWVVFSADSADKALALVQSGPIDLVLADLATMGEQCSEFIHEIAPLPVIVTSERDDCDGLIDALEAGAVNYIPRHLRHDRLFKAIQSALSSALATSKRARLLGLMDYSRSQFSIPTDLSMLSAAADRLQASLEMFGLCEVNQTIQVRIAIDEALANAYYHGNLAVGSQLKESGSNDFEMLAQQRLHERPYCRRRITIEEHLTRDEARFIIRDEGAGFDIKQLDDPTDPESLTRCSGRGLLMMRHFLDDVLFNESGNEVTLVKRCVANEAPSDATVPDDTEQGASDVAMQESGAILESIGCAESWK